MPSCSIPGCRKSSRRNDALSYHRFPTTTNIALRSQWFQVAGLAGVEDGRSLYACSLHFNDSDFENVRHGKLHLRNLTQPTIDWLAVMSYVINQ